MVLDLANVYSTGDIKGYRTTVVSAEGQIPFNMEVPVASNPPVQKLEPGTNYFINVIAVGKNGRESVIKRCTSVYTGKI